MASGTLIADCKWYGGPELALASPMHADKRVYSFTNGGCN